MNKNKTEKGFLAITTVLIVTSLVMVLGIAAFHSGIISQEISVTHERAVKASSLADACLREGFSILKNNLNYYGYERLDIEKEEITVGGYVCDQLKVEDKNEYTKKVTSMAGVGTENNMSYKQSAGELRYQIESTEEDWGNYQEISNLEVGEGGYLSLQESFTSQAGAVTTRETSTGSDWTTNYSITDLTTDVDDLILDSTTSGNRISPPLSLDSVDELWSSQISWTSLETDGTVAVYTAINEDNTTAPTTWTQATNGSSIPNLTTGDDLTGKYLWTKQELTSVDTTSTPTLQSITETITNTEKVYEEVEGYRISPEYDISGTGTVKRSELIWQADTRTNDTVEVSTRVDNGGGWTPWKTTKNGTTIPDLEPGVEVTETTKIQIKTNFTGGPDFYPKLESIKAYLMIFSD